MVERCYNPKSKDYSNYGGRPPEKGPPVYIADIWYTPGIPGNPGVVAFYNWSISHGYKDGLSINRLDVNGPYSPDNCNWITMAEQSNNKRTSKYINDGYEKLTYASFERKYNLPQSFVSKHLATIYNKDQIVHYAKYKEWIKKDKDGIWRDADGNQRLLRSYN